MLSPNLGFQLEWWIPSYTSNTNILTWMNKKFPNKKKMTMLIKSSWASLGLRFSCPLLSTPFILGASLGKKPQTTMIKSDQSWMAQIKSRYPFLFILVAFKWPFNKSLGEDRMAIIKSNWPWMEYIKFNHPLLSSSIIIWQWLGEKNQWPWSSLVSLWQCKPLPIVPPI
jgi:hypothetical protein